MITQSRSLDTLRDTDGSAPAAATADTLPGLLAAARHDPVDRPALLASPDETLSHRQLLETVEATAACLARAGIGRQDRIAVVLPAGIDMLLAFLAVASRAVFVPLNPDCTETEFEYFLTSTGAARLLTFSGLDTPARDAARRLGLPVMAVTGHAREGLLFEETIAGNGPADCNPPAAGDTALILHTSGTTSTPKAVPLTHANLAVSARNLIASLSLTGTDRCLNMLPPYHIGALLDLLLAPLAAGGSVVVAGDPLPETFFENLHRFRPTWFQAVPTMLHALVNPHSVAAERLPAQDCPLRLIRSVSAPLPDDLRRRVEAVFRVPVIEIYGMTETAGVICSNPPDRIEPGSVGRPVNQDVAILDAEGNFARPGRRGEVIVRGENVFRGYEDTQGNGRDINADVFIGPWFRTGDEGWLDKHGYLFLSGRIKEIINRGGEKIAPAEVDAAAGRHPDVREAAAFPVHHESLGEDIALAVVPATADFDARRLQDYLAERLARYKVPRKIVTVTSLPRNRTGKLLRQQLAQEYGEFATTPGEAEWVAPEGEPARTLAHLWRRVLGVGRIGMHDHFFDLGGDSLAAMGFLTALQEQYGYDVHVTALYEHPTLAEFADYLASTRGTATAGNVAGELPEHLYRPLVAYLTAWRGVRRERDSLLVGLNTLGEKPPLYWCVQGFGELNSLAGALGHAQPVYGMRSLASIPGKAEVHNRPLARLYVEEILALQPQGPYYIGGFCEGGKVAFEIAAELRERGREVALLALHDKFVYQPYPGRVALFFCRPTLSNPYGFYHEPEKGWYRFYTGPVSVYRYDMGHDYNDPALPRFAEDLARELADAAAGRPSKRLIDLAAVASEPLPAAACQAELEVPGGVPVLMSPGESVTLRINVRNTSPLTWPAGESSGLILCNRWFNKRGTPRSDVDGRTPFPAPVEPGAAVTLPLTITAPRKSGPRVLHIDLADEGAAWFGDKGSTPARLRLRVMPGGGVLHRLAHRFTGRQARQHVQD